jgi:hypothetical protein
MDCHPDRSAASGADLLLKDLIFSGAQNMQPDFTLAELSLLESADYVV